MTTARTPFPAPPWDRVLASIGAVAALAFVVVALLTALPPVLAQAGARVADGSTAERVGAASLVVPEGWVVVGGPDELVIRTPDGALETTVSSTVGDARSALTEALTSAYGVVPTVTIGPVRTETLSSGLRVAHADVGEAAIVAVVETDAASLLFDAHVVEGRELADYRAAFGTLLAGVQP